MESQRAGNFHYNLMRDTGIKLMRNVASPLRPNCGKKVEGGNS
jgi:hypothetical protein